MTTPREKSPRWPNRATWCLTLGVGSVSQLGPMVLEQLKKKQAALKEAPAISATKKTNLPGFEIEDQAG